jgi:hypothetical protein
MAGHMWRKFRDLRLRGASRELDVDVTRVELDQGSELDSPRQVTLVT